MLLPTIWIHNISNVTVESIASSSGTLSLVLPKDSQQTRSSTPVLFMTTSKDGSLNKPAVQEDMLIRRLRSCQNCGCKLQSFNFGLRGFHGRYIVASTRLKQSYPICDSASKSIVTFFEANPTMDNHQPVNFRLSRSVVIGKIRILKYLRIKLFSRK